MQQKLKMGMIGGGISSSIGPIHRIAANLDGQIELVCGVFSSNHENSIKTGKSLFLNNERIYASFQEMIERELLLPTTERMDFVSIVTPNHLHFAPAKLALENGFHVICDKPATFDLKEALELEKIIQKTGKLFALTHTYSGYPMVKEAKDMIESGKLGTIRKVIVQYPQGWLAKQLEKQGNKQAEWRTDPERSGISGCMADIGIHAQNLAEYVTGLKITEVCADLSSFVDGRILDDDGSVLFRMENGVKGILHATQIAAGEENNINISVYGEKGSLQWQHEDNNTLKLKWDGKPAQLLRTGGGMEYLSKVAQVHARVAAGHPEGYLEAFANIYRNFAYAIQACKLGGNQNELYDFPSIKEGIRGMLFIEKVVESSQSSTKWIKM